METVIRHVTDALPPELDELRITAGDEGYRILNRLAEDWSSHTLRFDREGERLVAAYRGGELAGIGGLTIESALKKALRMRRFYVHPRFRRQGVGRQLAEALLDHATHLSRPTTVNAGTSAAPAFWEALGFVRIHHSDFTHVLQRPGA